MTELQWALVIIGAAAVIGIYFYSRRDRALKDWQPPGASDSPLKPKPPTKEQMEMFQSTGQYDEYGVSRPRVAGGARRTPELTAGKGPAAPVPETDAEPMPLLVPNRGAKKPVDPPPPKVPEPAAEKLKPVIARYEEKFIAFLIAEREGTNIFGPKLHTALQAQKLEFGIRQIYHRHDQGMVQFSVASLLQPGTLDPAEAGGFSTPGLSVFMVLPGPVKPVAAFDDMLATSRALARALNGEVFDMQRKPLSEDSARILRADVEAWARDQNLG